MIVPDDTAERSSGYIRLAALLLAVVTAAGLVLRMGLSDYSMWYDEFASVAFADQPLRLLWSDWMIRETNPPLFYSLLHGWMKAFGHSLSALRMLPIVLGTIGIGLVAAVGWIASGRRAGVLAGALTAISAQHVYYSHTVRAYILAFDGVALALLGLAMIVTGRSRRAGLACYVVGSTIAIHAHTTMYLWLPAAMLGLCAAVWRELWADRARLFLQLAFANLVVLALAAWWLRMTLLQLRVSRGNIDWIETLGPADALQLMMQTIFLARGESFWPWAASLLCAAAAIAGAVFDWRNPATRMIAITAAASICLFCLAEGFQPILLERTVVWMSVFPPLLVAAMIGRHGAGPRIRAATAGALLCVLGANLAFAQSRFQRQDWLPALKQIERTPGGALLVEHEGLGVVSLAACKVAFPTRNPCPFPIVAMRSDKRTDTWASGLADGIMTDPMRLRGAFAPDARIYALRQGALDPVETLAGLGAPIRPTATRAWPEGPYARDLLIIPK